MRPISKGMVSAVTGGYGDKGSRAVGKAGPAVLNKSSSSVLEEQRYEEARDQGRGRIRERSTYPAF